MVATNRHPLKPTQLQEHPLTGAIEVIEKTARIHPPRIERRRITRDSYRTKAWLEPADETGALRTPMLHSRDLDSHGMGFLARHDLSAVGDVVLHLPTLSGRPIRITGSVRRSREIGNGWFEGLIEFAHEQPRFSVRRTNSR